jgi:DNA polymerase III delta prime subunit
LQDTAGIINSEGLKPENFQSVLRTDGETENMHDNVQNWLELNESDSRFRHLTEEEIAAGVVTSSAVQER